MTDALDLLLDQAREPEPEDDAFVMRVMAEVRQTETKREGRRWLRRPTIIGVSAAIVVTGGAVAALVGTNPGADRATPEVRPPAVQVSAEPKATSSSASTDATSDGGSSTSGDAAAQTAKPTGAGYDSKHSSFVVDTKTGIVLRTEAYTTDFTANEPQRVTLTVENTGEYPVAFEASEGCALQVMATGTGSNLLEWVCAGSDADPKVPGPVDTWILAPGEKKTADASVVLDAGAWGLSGMCRCTFEQLEPTPVPKADPLSELGSSTLGTKALPSVEPPEFTLDRPDGTNLVTPPIAVRVE